MSDKRHYPFSFGTQVADWIDYNCDLCKKSGNELNPELCEIEFALFYDGDGSVSEDIATRMGLFDFKCSLVWRCREFEPEDDND